MKFIKPLLLVSLPLVLTTCRKQPVADFSTDQTEYIAGDTVHLTNTSQNGYSFKWYMPDGSSADTKNADFLTNPNFGFGRLTFILKAFSKHEKKTDFVSKSVDIIPASVFSIDSGLSPNFSYMPRVAVEAYTYNSHWQVTAYTSLSQPMTSDYLHASAGILIKFYDSSLPTSGTYLLQPDDALTPGHAHVGITRFWWENNTEDFNSLSGEMKVNITNGKFHVEFTHINADHFLNGVAGSNAIISGDITCP